MMKAVVNVTRKANLPTVCSLNPIMVDGTGMCGACRVEVGGKTMFGCVDGPEFDGLQVDFDLLMKRLAMYKGPELIALNKFKETARVSMHYPRRCSMTEQEKKEKKPKVPRQKMPEQDPLERAQNFYEVALGYDNDLALLEASRCLHCKKPYCMTGCPVEVDIPDFVEMVKAGDFIGASWKVKEKKAYLESPAEFVHRNPSVSQSASSTRREKANPALSAGWKGLWQTMRQCMAKGSFRNAEAHGSQGGSGRFRSCRSNSGRGSHQERRRSHSL